MLQVFIEGDGHAEAKRLIERQERALIEAAKPSVWNRFAWLLSDWPDSCTIAACQAANVLKLASALSSLTTSWCRVPARSWRHVCLSFRINHAWSREVAFDSMLMKSLVCLCLLPGGFSCGPTQTEVSFRGHRVTPAS